MRFRSLWSGRSLRLSPHAPRGTAHRRPVEQLERRTLLSTTLTAVADADVQNLASDGNVANANFGADETLRVRRADGESFETFVTFDVREIASVGHAMLKMHGGQAGTPGEPVLVGAFPTTDGFTEGDGTHGGPLDLNNNPAGEIRWNNRPGSAGGAFFAAIVSTVGDYYWNLTEYVRSEKVAGKSFVTVALKHTSGGTGQVSFTSREGSGGDRPQLIVEQNGSGPQAAFFAPDITGTLPDQQVVVTYSDSDGIDPASIDTGDIVVRAPGGPELDVLGVTVQQADANSIIATYTVAAPGGSWDSADNEAYTTLLKEGAVKDLAGNPATGGPDVFTVSIDAGTPPAGDTVAPVARIPDRPGDVREEGGTGLILRATFTDNVGVVADALTTSSLVITPQGGAAGTALEVLDVGVEPSDGGRTVTALFSVFAPGGSWDAADNATYDVRLVQGAVRDAAGNLSNEVLESFKVDIGGGGGGNPPPTPPGAPDVTGPVTTVVPQEPIAVGGATSQQIRVTYVDNAAVNLASIDPADIVVTGPGGVPLPVTEVSVTPPAGGASVIATYTVAAPGGSWDSADNGVYTVTVGAGAAVDTSNNPSAPASATFEVAVPAPEPSVDPSFGGGATSTVETGFVAEAAAAQTDGKIIVVGRQGDIAAGTSQLVVQRLNVDGSPDASFGSGGKVLGAQGANEAGYAVAVADDGSIVVAGRRGGDLMVTRFKANGALDTRFGTGGFSAVDFGGDDVAYSLILAADGSVVAAGGSTQPTGEAFAFARFLKDGQVDRFFGDGGRSLFAQGAGGNVAGAVTIDSSGRVVAAGPTDGGNVAVVRLNANGTEDASFGTGGAVILTQLTTQGELGRPDRSIGVVAQPDGSVLVSNRSPSGDFGIAKVRGDGTLDPSFGTGGVSSIDFGGDDDADQLLLQGTGEIFAIGTTTAGGNMLAVAAVAPDGSLIRNFGDNGKLTVDATPTAATRALRIGDLVLRAFGSVTQDGRLVLGASDQRPAAVTSTPLRRLNVPGSSLVGTFGQTGGTSRRGKKLPFMDADGTVVTISIKGPGTGQVFSDGGAVDIMLSGISNSSLVITAKGGADGRFTVRNIQSDGPLKSVSAKTVNVTGTFSVNGAVGKASMGNLTGTLAAAGPISSILFNGDVKGRVLSGANYGVNGSPGGTGSAADGYGAGRIGKITVAGSMTGATVAAGVDPVDSQFLDADDKLVGGAASSIGVVTVKGGADASTRFVAGAFGPKAKLPRPILTADDPRFMLLQ